MVILENPKIVLPTDTIALAMILEKYATDWKSTLEFLADFCETTGIPLDVEGIENCMQEIYLENE